jgi:hypothetical protein
MSIDAALTKINGFANMQFRTYEKKQSKGLKPLVK